MHELTAKARKFLRSTFVRHVLTVASGTAAAQAITFAFSPIITRIYGPEAFGQLGSFLALLAVVTPAAALAYPIAIVLPRDDREALNLAKFSLYLSCVISILTAWMLWGWGPQLINVLRLEAVDSFLFLVPIAMLFAAWLEIMQQWLIRNNEFGVIARTAVARSLLVNIANVAFGWFKSIGSVLLVITTVGTGLHAVLLLMAQRERRKSMLVGNVTGIFPIWKTVSRYRDFALYRAPQNMTNAVSQSVPILMLATLFGTTAAGYYALARLVMGAPSGLLGKAVSDVFYPRITRVAQAGGAIVRDVIRATVGLAAISIMPFAIIFLYGPKIFAVAFGPQWYMAGEYARWLTFFFFFNFINKPCVAAAPVLGIQRGLLLYELFSSGIKIIGLFVGFYWCESEISAVALFSLSGAVAYIIMMVWIVAHAQQRVFHEKAS